MSKKRQFVIGDIHGAYRALIQVLERSQFDYEHDELITLGDIVDGWPETPEVIEELMKIKNLVLVIGNHDVWAIDWLKYGRTPLIWTEQGGQATIDAYVQRHGDLMAKHRDKFWKYGRGAMLDEQDRLFVHGGVQPDVPFEHKDNDLRYITWDRDLAYRVINQKSVSRWTKYYNEIYLGHTTTEQYQDTPMAHGHVWLMDSGAGWGGKLSMMDINTKEIYQSDIVKELYPGVKGR